ncbi:S-layer homology domain-containing protein [Paenibacillus dauci]|uniref:S-layer homology domain-containing protein n=1 Tax=Paenibacillus dauci TaxID=1567106 RepID=UPI0006967047|nr:S-layer homology domain-containing protein [Paenibacillus dauci]
MKQWKKKVSLSAAAIMVASAIAPAGTITSSIYAEQLQTEVAPALQKASISVEEAAHSVSVSANTYALSEIRQQNTGSRVTARGWITYREDTGSNYSNLYIQDGSAGIVIRGQNLPGEPGQEIETTGKLSEYRKLLQIEASAADTYIREQTPQTVSARTITAADFTADTPYEGQLVRINKVTVTGKNSNNYTLQDSSGNFTVYSKSPWLTAGESYDSVTGVMSRYNDSIQLIPRSVEDIAGAVPPVVEPPIKLSIHDIQGASQRSPYEGREVREVEGIVTMVKGKTTFYMQTEDALADQDDRTSEAVMVYKSAHGMKVGDRVSVDGVVKEYKETGYSDASDLTTTEIAAFSINRLAENQPLPQPTIIGQGGRIIPGQIASAQGLASFDPASYSIDLYESLEGMRVQLNNASIIGPYTYEIPVAVDMQPGLNVTPAGGLVIANNQFNPNRLLIGEKPKQPVKTGDRFEGPLYGIMSYSYSNFKILPEKGLPSIISGGLKREVSALHNGTEQLTIASFNVENFWDDPANQEKTRRIAQNVVQNLHTPDIIGLMEVQDNNGEKDDGTADAQTSFNALIREIRAAGGPEYRYTSIAPQNNEDGGAPGGNIRVGFLYNPARVTLAEAAGGTGDSVTAVTYGPQGLTHNPGRIEPGNEAFANSRKSLAAQFIFHGRQVIVVANHFNSKGGDQPLYGAAQPPQRISEVQRAKQATLLSRFIQDTLAQNSSANIVLVGDFNDYQFSNTLQILKGNVLTNLVDTLPENERYSYVYEGNSQTLDHILMTGGLAARAQLDIVHLNADFMEADGRVSDHDPLLARIDFSNRSNNDKDDDKDHPGRIPGNGTSSGNNGNSGAGGSTPPVTPTPPAAVDSMPIAAGASTDGTVSSWSLPVVKSTDGEDAVAVAGLSADATAAMLTQSGEAQTLNVRLQSTQATDTYRLQWQPEAQQLLTEQGRIKQITVTTPIGSYDIPVNWLQASNSVSKRLVLEMSADPAAMQQAEGSGYQVRSAVQYNLYTLDNNENKQPIQQMDRYIRRTLQVDGLVPADRIAVVRVDTDTNGRTIYTSVPFNTKDGAVTLFSRSNSTYAVLNSAVQLNDVSGHWAQADISRLADQRVITGTVQGSFRPDAAVTRAEMAALLVRALGLSGVENGSTSFRDIDNSAWYEDSVRTAAHEGLIQGDASGRFRPNATITRQEMAVMIERALDYIGAANVTVSSSPPVDTAKAAVWARPAIDHLSASGLLNGNAKGQFQPTKNLTRAESAAIIQRLLNQLTGTSQ